MRIGGIKLVIVVALAVSMAVAGCGKAAGEPSVDELLSLGEKYLEELDYEQALARFLQVIELEPRRVEAYLGAADAYGGMGELDEAVAILERGLELTGDERLRERLGVLLAMQEPETPQGSPRVENPVARVLYDYLIVGDNEAAYEYCQSEEYLAAYKNSVIRGGEFGFCGDVDEQGVPEGTGAAYYPCRYVYFGDWKNGVREGQGIYFDFSDNAKSFIEGSWVNDLPNGMMVETVEYYDPVFDDLRDSSAVKTITGNCVDGWWDGEIDEILVWASGKVCNYRYKVENGFMVAIGETTNGNYPYSRCLDCGVEIYIDVNVPQGIFPFYLSEEET